MKRLTERWYYSGEGSNFRIWREKRLKIILRDIENLFRYWVAVIYKKLQKKPKGYDPMPFLHYDPSTGKWSEIYEDKS